MFCILFVNCFLTARRPLLLHYTHIGDLCDRKEAGEDRLTGDLCDRKEAAEHMLTGDLCDRKEAGEDRLTGDLCDRKEAGEDRLTGDLCDRKEAGEDRLTGDSCDRKEAVEDMLTGDLSNNLKIKYHVGFIFSSTSPLSPKYSIIVTVSPVLGTSVRTSGILSTCKIKATLFLLLVLPLLLLQ